jgi:hypothetical protein
MLPEQKACLIVIITRKVIIKHPTAMFGTACLVNQLTGLVILPGKKMADGTCWTVSFSFRQVDMTIIVQGSD